MAASTTVQPRLAAGQQLRTTLKEIFSLEAAGKVNAARARELQTRTEVHMSAGGRGHSAGQAASRARQEACAAESHAILLAGQLADDSRVLTRLLNTPEVKRLLPGSARRTRCEQADAKFAFRVAAEEVAIEGGVWLALLDGKAFQLQ